MSSSKEFKSKVFKADTLFMPHSLVRQTLDFPPVADPEPDNAVEDLDLQVEEEIPEREEQPEETITQPPLPPEPEQDPEPPSPPPEPEAVQEPQIDLEALRQEGYTQGYDQGMADCAAQLQANFDQGVQSFVTACQKIDKLNQERLAGTHADLVNLVIALTEKILSQELTTPRNQIATTLENALEQAIASEEFHVSLNPEDLALAEERAPALVNSIRALEHLVFKPDPGIRRGGCLLESVTCSVDATIDGKLENTRELLTEHPEFVLGSEEEREQQTSPVTEQTPEAVLDDPLQNTDLIP
jgi:flagellar assembly protein FliH